MALYRIVHHGHNGQRYDFWFREGDLGELNRELGRMCADDELSFNWPDVVAIQRRLRPMFSHRKEAT